MKHFEFSDIQQLLNPTEAQEHKQLPLPPMPQPLPFSADTMYGPEWEGGFESAKARFVDMWKPSMNQIKRLLIEASRTADGRKRERAVELEKTRDAKLAEMEKEWREADEVEAAEAAEKKNAFLEEGATAATAADMLEDVRAKHHEDREEARRQVYILCADEVHQLRRQPEFNTGEIAKEEGMPMLREMVAKGVWESAIVYALIRLGRFHPVAPLLSAFLDSTGRAGALINAPIPTDESWLIHRACWDAHPEVVRVLTRRGAITNRLSRYNEHPALTVQAALKQDPQHPRCTEREYTEIINIIAETYMRGTAHAPAPAPASPSAATVETGNPHWLQQLPRAAAAGQRHVYVTGVPFEYPMESLCEWFTACGKVQRMHANAAGDAFAELRAEKIGANDAKHGGACVIVFATPEAAAKALAYDGYPLLTRRIHVTAHKPTDAEKERWRAENMSAAEARYAEEIASAALGAKDAKAKAITQAMKKEQRRLKQEKQHERAAQKEAKRREKLAKQAEEKRAKREEKARAAQEASMSELAHGGAVVTEVVAEAGEASAAPTADGVPHWASRLPGEGPTQTHVFMLDVPFEAAPELVEAAARKLPGAVDVYVPTRALKDNSAHDQRLAASLSALRGMPVRTVHKGWCVVQLRDANCVRQCVQEFDGMMLMDVPVRILRARANKSLTVAQNKERETSMAFKERQATETLSFVSALPTSSYAAVTAPAGKRKDREDEDADALAVASSQSFLSKLTANTSIAGDFLSRRKRAKVRAEGEGENAKHEDEEFVL